MIRPLILVVTLSLQAPAAVPGIPDVRFQDSRVTGYPAANHKVLKQEMTVIQTEDCAATGGSGAQMKVSNRCGYVRGVYHYQYQPSEGKEPVDLYMGFGLHAEGNSHTFMVSAPLMFSAKLAD